LSGYVEDGDAPAINIRADVGVIPITPHVAVIETAATRNGIGRADEIDVERDIRRRELAPELHRKSAVTNLQGNRTIESPDELELMHNDASSCDGYHEASDVPSDFILVVECAEVDLKAILCAKGVFQCARPRAFGRAPRRLLLPARRPERDLRALFNNTGGNELLHHAGAVHRLFRPTSCAWPRAR
jgi:hypothetical protein